MFESNTKCGAMLGPSDLAIVNSCSQNPKTYVFDHLEHPSLGRQSLTKPDSLKSMSSTLLSS